MLLQEITKAYPQLIAALLALSITATTVAVCFIAETIRNKFNAEQHRNILFRSGTQNMVDQPEYQPEPVGA